MDDLKVGDMVVVNNGGEQRVLARVENLVALSFLVTLDTFCRWCSISELKTGHYRLKTDPDKMTIDQISKELGRDVEVIDG